MGQAPCSDKKREDLLVNPSYSTDSTCQGERSDPFIRGIYSNRGDSFPLSKSRERPNAYRAMPMGCGAAPPLAAYHHGNAAHHDQSPMHGIIADAGGWQTPDHHCSRTFGYGIGWSGTYRHIAHTGRWHSPNDDGRKSGNDRSSDVRDRPGIRRWAYVEITDSRCGWHVITRLPIG